MPCRNRATVAISLWPKARIKRVELREHRSGCGSLGQSLRRRRPDHPFPPTRAGLTDPVDERPNRSARYFVTPSSLSACATLILCPSERPCRRNHWPVPGGWRRDGQRLQLHIRMEPGCRVCVANPRDFLISGSPCVGLKPSSPIVIAPKAAHPERT